MTSNSTPAQGAASTTVAALEARGLGHSYGPRQILGGIDFSVEQGEFVCIVGPSGVGKTTLLRCLSGLQVSTAGELHVLGSVVKEPQPGVALVFQDYSRSLMPWASVLENVTLPLRANRVSKKDANARAYEALEQVGLAAAVGDQYPWQLSGGMQQRVAIARALAYDPTVLLMDEPFASVDAQTRSDLEDLVLRLQRRLGLTVILVTHDIDESVYLSDRIVVLAGSPAHVAEIVDVPLGAERDQIGTKSDPAFATTRAHVHNLVRAAAAVSPSTGTARVVDVP
ncbi:NitT/TauT family transport system ATP-binding protein [Microbacterium ginsengiterrae]|uniref:NitT/TauT family transport system ATP-binding protein n=1 Tax=Microbacterium ginsengiterrae TaxID=546115 RepID=A0A7W9CCH3_9MICO|nr:ABC transporter ATP-binding protein [Microbacterium ginsengiterrae]MBB5742911.1 NitT/TauT family transport system ATP-binding protein [Microbacterium ginsengiterrae]